MTQEIESIRPALFNRCRVISMGPMVRTWVQIPSPEDSQMEKAMTKRPETIFIIRDSAEQMEVDFCKYVESIPRDKVAKIMRGYKVKLVDGTWIIGMSKEQAEHGTRGYSNVRYV